MASPYEYSRLGEDTQLIEVSESKVKYINKNYAKVNAKMYDFTCDIKLKVGTETFRAHKEVLSEASMYFSAMFSHNMREKEQDVIELHEISPPGFAAMMEYFYHGHLTISLSNIANIVEAARFFHIEWLISVCCDFLVKHLSIENYDSTLELADKYYLGDLREDIFQFVTLNFASLAKEQKFMHVSFEIFHTILSENLFIEATEGFIFQTMLKWLDFDKENRETYKSQLLDLIRFPLIDINDLEAIPDEVRKWPEIEEYITDAMNYHVKPYAQCLSASEKTEARGSVQALVLVDAIDDAQHFQYKVPESAGFLKEAIDTSFMDSVFEFSAVTVLGNFLFVAGGYDRLNWCSSPAFYHYDPRNRSWAELQSMCRPRVSFPLVASDSGLYAVAGIEHLVHEGRDIENIHNTVEFYNPEENSWHFLPELAFGVFSCAAAMYKQNLYISGGISSDPEDNVPVNYLMAYIAGNRTWAPLAPMLTPRQGHAMVSHDDKLFALGGYTDGQDTMSFDNCFINEMYDIETDQWSRVKDIPLEHGHWHSAATVMDDKIYILGGNGADQLRFLHSYDTKEEQISEGEYCGPCVQKLNVMKIPLPKFLLENSGDDESAL